MENVAMNEGIKFAGFWERVLASLIDSIWMYGIIYSILIAIYSVEIFSPETEYSAVQFFFEYIIPLVVVLLFWHFKSATPGKMLLKMKIVDADTFEKVPNSRLFIRYIAYFASTIPLCLGFMWVGWDKRKQGWHDKIARTVVIKSES
jgi:uncharacterized RDD family membrane protein YckC